MCCECIVNLNMNCFNCEMERECKTCLDRISQKKTYSTDINMLKRKPANECHQMLPCYEGKYEPKQNNVDLGSARRILMKKDDKMFVKRGFERIYFMMEVKSYTKDEEIPEYKEIFVYGFKHIKTDQLDNYIKMGWEPDEFYENDEPLNLWSTKFTIKEIEMRNFNITGWSFMTSVTRNNFPIIQGVRY